MKKNDFIYYVGMVLVFIVAVLVCIVGIILFSIYG